MEDVIYVTYELRPDYEGSFVEKKLGEYDNIEDARNSLQEYIEDMKEIENKNFFKDLVFVINKMLNEEILSEEEVEYDLSDSDDE